MTTPGPTCAVCGRSEPHADEAHSFGMPTLLGEATKLRDQRDWFRLRWALARGCSPDDAQRAYERDLRYRRSMEAEVSEACRRAAWDN